MSNNISSLENLMPSIGSDLKLKFESFFELLDKYNSKLNLVSKASIPFAGAKHFADSFFGINHIKPHLTEVHPVFDFGSGNGFPGIIGAAMLPEYSFILVERDQRKAEFLKIAADHLGLKNVEVYAGKVTDLANGSCFQIISRAMAPIPKFLLECRMVTQIGGTAFLFKADHWSTEFGAVPAPLFEYWEVEMGSAYDLPSDQGKRYIIHCNRI